MLEKKYQPTFFLFSSMFVGGGGSNIESLAKQEQGRYSYFSFTAQGQKETRERRKREGGESERGERKEEEEREGGREGDRQIDKEGRGGGWGEGDASTCALHPHYRFCLKQLSA
jgi:hypothetical protein